MDIQINLELIAKDAPKAVHRGDVITIIDVLRCSSTIISALANDAAGVIPTKTIKKANLLHEKNPEYVLAGERRGIKPRGFDLGNSPLEFSRQTVGGKNIILTTTSGTKAMSLAKSGKWVLVGAFLNSKAVAELILKLAEKEEAGISLVLSGKSGRFSFEDFLCAGAITDNFPTKKVEYTDGIRASLLAFKQAVKRSLNTVIQSGEHAQYLKSMGKEYEEDVNFCCQLNRYDVVPYLKDNFFVPFNTSQI